MARRKADGAGRRVVSLDEHWSIGAAPSTPARPSRGARRTAMAGDADDERPRDMLEFLKAQPRLKTVNEVLAETRAPRRRAGEPPRPLRMAVTGAKPTGAYVAVARHESGTLTFHLPEAATAGAARRGAAKSNGAEVVFRIPLLPSDEFAPVGGNAFQRRGIISKIIKVVVFEVAKIVVEPILRLLARKLEERMWASAKRPQGWVRVTREALADPERVKLKREAPNFAPGERGLLLLHGTFSNAASAFRGLGGEDFYDEVARRYGGRVYAFEHFTISKGPQENVKELLDALPSGKRMRFDVITHSRGGLVLRTLALRGAGKIDLGRAVLVASPNQGTPLATPQRWEDTVGWFANLMEMIPDNPFTTCAEWIAESLTWLARSVVGAGGLPGLNSMDGNGDVVRDLRDVVLAADHTYALCANFEPDAGMLLRLADMGIDAFFAGANDLVVPTAGGWDLGPFGGDGDLPAAQIGCFGPGGNIAANQAVAVHHVNFFGNAEGRRFIRQALAGDALGLPPVSTLAALPRRSARDRLTADVAPAAPGTVTVTVAPPPAAAAGTGGATAAPTVTAQVTVGSTWVAEETMNLLVLPAGGRIDDSDAKTTDGMLLATYGSARVLAPFHLRGAADGAGRRWQQIIGTSKLFERYMNDGVGEPPTEEQLVDYGAKLFDVLFGGEVRRLYDQARHRHRFRRLNVIFTSMIPWVADFPWELAYDGGCSAFLASGDVRFIRNVISSVAPDNIPLVTGPLRILLVSSQPKDWGALSVDAEQGDVMRAFQPLIDMNAVAVDVLPRGTVETLHAWVRQRPYDVVHFIGHGEFRKNAAGEGTGYLIFEDEQRKARPLPTGDVKNILRSRGIRLVFLNACQTGQGGRADYNKGVAPGLVADGVPAVVANQYSVFDRSATIFAKNFYWCLAQGLSLGDAARESRIAMEYSGLGALDWAVPVLFARNPDARLCEGSVRMDVPRG